MRGHTKTDHEQLKLDDARWAELPLVGEQVVPAFGDEPELCVELRKLSGLSLDARSRGAVMATVQAPATPASTMVTVEVTVEEALGVGYSIRALVRQAKLPPGTQQVYEQLAAKLIAAARAEIRGAH